MVHRLKRCTWRARDSTIFPIQAPRGFSSLKDGRLTGVIDGAGSVCRRVGAGIVVVNKFFQLFARFEVRNTFSGNTHRIAGLRISPAPGAAVSHTKTAKAAQLNLLA